MEQSDSEALCPNPTCDELAAALAVAALGGEIAPGEQSRLLAALITCGRCRQRLAQYAAIAQALPLTVPEAEPSADLRDRIVVGAQRTPQAGQAVGPAPRRRPAPLRRDLLRPVLTIALALVLLFSGWQQLRLLQQQEQIGRQQAQASRSAAIVLAAFGNDDAQEGLLEPTGNAPEASGRFFLSPGEPALAIYVKHLPVPPAGQEYQIWVFGGGRTVSAGTFGVNAEGRAWRLVQPGEPLGVVERIFVTLEPQGGSAQPGGAEYLTGRPR